MAEIVRAGLVQQRWTGDKESMIAAAVDHIRTAASAGAQVVCLQELFYGPYFCQVQDADYYSYTEAIPDGPTTRLLQDVARQHHIVIVAPMYEEEHPGIYYNTAAVIDADGSYLGKYRKTHIPQVKGFWEKFYFRPGNLGYPVFDTAAGQPIGHQPGPVPVPVAARAARVRGGQRVLHRRDQPGRHRAAGRQRLLRPDLLRGPARPACG
jgi:beta-ureidopropionase